MTNVTPIHQPAAEALRTAAFMAGSWALSDFVGQEEAAAFAGLERLIRHALTELSEPSLAAMQAGAILLAEWQGTPEPQRQLRDTLAGIIAAQVSGQVPGTWAREP